MFVLVDVQSTDTNSVRKLVKYEGDLMELRNLTKTGPKETRKPFTRFCVAFS